MKKFRRIFIIITISILIIGWFRADFPNISDSIIYFFGGIVEFSIIYFVFKILYSILSIFIPKNKKFLVKENKKILKQNKIKPTYVENILDSFNNQKSNTKSFKISNQERTEGAYITLNRSRLEENKKEIYNGIITRNDDLRKKAKVYGYYENQKYVIVSGKKEYLYHRTHLLPFRYTLSEGDDADGLLITGTSYLNSGNRPDKNYKVPEDEFSLDGRKGRQVTLKSKIKKFYCIKDIKVDKNLDVNYSLDDIERLVDSIILERDYIFNYKYGVFCNYDDNQKIPSSVTAILRTDKDILFEITLPNVL